MRAFLHFFAIGVQSLNCTPSFRLFFQHTSTFYKKSQVLCLLSARFCRNPHQFYRCIKEERTVPRRKPLGSAFFLFVIQVFLSKQSSRPNGRNGGALGSTSDVTVTVSSCAAGSRPRFAAAYPPPRNAFSALFKAAIQSGLDLKPFTKKHLRRLPGSTGAFFAFRIYKSHSAAGLSSTPLTALQAFFSLGSACSSRSITVW